MRSIDVDELLEKRWDADTRVGYVQVVDAGDIEEAPTLDVVAVVRCKDCIYYKRVIGAVGGWCDCTYTDFETEPDDYCSFGMREE